ncbi:2Fe-2S iron-sulfur cluster-binding protein [Streptomyces sp. NBC_00285]|uniref:2Fe-2S iron-sulfur cluster-binding protein n=1 Tax=Streptomyces sp. NBC_00285 TaxID=2975700 RepID=UPI002E2CC672|nr:2Fe-2S iron-sulfur cluster-binding protein [Streptomyces sp. NBC_00285]
MTDDQHGEGTPRAAGRWDPLPQGDYDDGATAFVKLPEGGIDALLASADSPLAARGQGYVPPQITAAPGDGTGTDPAGTGAWGAPAEGTGWPDPNAVPQGQTGQFTYNPASTQQWNVEDTAAAPVPGHDVTGQWSIPVVGGDLPDESGEFTTSALVEQWGGTPPATLPGGASAPWATQPAQPWDDPAQGGAGAADERHAHVPHGEGHAGDAYAVEAAETQADTHTDVHVPPAAHTEDHAPADPSEQPTPTAHTRAEPGRAPHDPAEPSADSPSTAASRPTPGAGEAPAAPEDSDDAHGAVEAADGPAEPGTEHAPPVGDDDEPESEAAEEHAADPDADENPDERAPAHSGEEHPLASFVLRVNGVDRPVTDAWIGESLLYVLRERLGLAGAKDGCSQGECGACNVQVDGRLVASCLVPAVTASGSEVRTVEGLAADGRPSDVQRALARCGAVQCGFCVPGMAMTVHDLLEGNPAPTEMETRTALCGNLCRCSGYRGVVDAVKEVVAEREAHATGDGETDGDEARIPHQAGPGGGSVHASAFDSPGFPGAAGPHEQAYGQGQDGGQA